MNNLMKLFRQHTSLTAMQVELVKRMSACMPFLADLAHAHIGLYVPTTDKKKLLVVASQQPHTIYLTVSHAKVGSLVPMQEEPLLSRTLATGKAVKGKREWSLGSIMEMFTYPVYDNDNLLAVVSIETQSNVLQMEGFAELMDTAKILLQQSKKILPLEQYKELHAGDGLLIADKHNRILFANSSAARIYRVLGVSNLVGRHLFDRPLTQNIKKEIVHNEHPYEKELEIGDLAILQRSIVMREGGDILRQIIVLSDITEVRQKDKEIKLKAAIIQEIHHRVKNNLQTVASLLRMQARRSSLPEVQQALQESVDRILSISLAHEFLSLHDTEEVEVTAVTRDVLNMVRQNMLAKDFVLHTELPDTKLVLPARQAGSFALLVNELATNALKHGFKGRKSGIIGLKITAAENDYTLDFYDNGCGLPADFSLAEVKTLGLQIVKSLVENEMQGNLKLLVAEGTHVILEIPKMK